MTRKQPMRRTGFKTPTLAEFKAAARYHTKRFTSFRDLGPARATRVKLLVPAEGAAVSDAVMRLYVERGALKAKFKRGGTVTLVRRAPLLRRSKDRAKRARVKQRQYGPPDMIAWHKAQPCQIHLDARCGYFPPRRPRNEVCHILTRGSGRGHTVDGKPNTFTGCPVGHDATEELTPGQVYARFGVELWTVAQRQRAEYEAQR